MLTPILSATLDTIWNPEKHNCNVTNARTSFILYETILSFPIIACLSLWLRQYHKYMVGICFINKPWGRTIFFFLKAHAKIIMAVEGHFNHLVLNFNMDFIFHFDFRNYIGNLILVVFFCPLRSLNLVIRFIFVPKFGFYQDLMM